MFDIDSQSWIYFAARHPVIVKGNLAVEAPLATPPDLITRKLIHLLFHKSCN